MEKILLLFSIISFISCSKPYNEPEQLITTPPVVALTAYPVDLNFTINPYCNFAYDTIGSYTPFFEKSIYFTASCNGTIGGVTINVYRQLLGESYYYFSNTYTSYSTRVYIYEQFTNNTIEMVITDFNMFLLDYNNGAATFSATCRLNSGSGKYINVGRGTNTLSITGIADPVSHTGSYRIQGTLYY